MKSTLKLVTFALAAVVLASCGPSGQSVNQSAVTSDLSGLVRDTSVSPTLVFKRPDAPTLAAYNRFIIDQPLFDYRDPAMKEIAVDDIRRMQSYFYGAVVKELKSGGYQVVTRSQPNTMRISFIVSGMKAPNALPNIVSAFAPVAISVGEVTVEGIFRDALTNRVDAVALNKAQGSRVLNAKPWSTWADVEGSFDNWAKGIRAAVDKAHGR